ncbi:MAG: hypothetical protein Q4G50_14375 [Corynebacterium sp.]|uniref:hypothetical protein n=1 Tax=Corynebacterium sp. TaxID=1720 RepID=UPI0026DF4707|nr:hypothetical protein [Corynebacterium sp.]MDO5671173.1 hypothetical protein [Corynebacterium sp.]
MSSPTSSRASSSPAPVPARPLADAVAADLRAIPGVADLHPGRYGEVALLYPRHRVTGLRHTPDRLEVHLVVDLDHPQPLAEVADRARAVVEKHLRRTADIIFADAQGGQP